MPPNNYSIPEHGKIQIQHYLQSGKLRQLLADVKKWVLPKPQGISPSRLGQRINRVKIQRQEYPPVKVEFEGRSLPIYSGIGVGVYQGRHVILRGLAEAYSSQNWVVERLRSYNLRHIPKQLGFQLYQLAVLLILLQQCDHTENDLQILDEIELVTDCPYSTRLKRTESSSEVVCGSDDCPLQKLLLRVLRQQGQSQYSQRLLCPLSPLVHQY